MHTLDGSCIVLLMLTRLCTMTLKGYHRNPRRTHNRGGGGVKAWEVGGDERERQKCGRWADRGRFSPPARLLSQSSFQSFSPSLTSASFLHCSNAQFCPQMVIKPRHAGWFSSVRNTLPHTALHQCAHINMQPTNTPPIIFPLTHTHTYTHSNKRYRYWHATSLYPDIHKCATCARQPY